MTLNRAGVVIVSQIERAIQDAESWQNIAKNSVSYRGDLEAIRSWLALPGTPLEYPTPLQPAGDSMPDNPGFHDTYVDPAYPGTQEHKNELRNDLASLLYSCRVHGATEVETAYAILQLLREEIEVCTSAEHWGQTAHRAGRDPELTPELGFLNMALRHIYTRRKQRKCNHHYMRESGSQHQCSKCEDRIWVDSDSDRFENLMERGKSDAEQERRMYS